MRCAEVSNRVGHCAHLPTQPVLPSLRAGAPSVGHLGDRSCTETRAGSCGQPEGGMWCEALLNGTPPSAACTKKHVARVPGFAPAGNANSQRGQRARDTAWDTAQAAPSLFPQSGLTTRKGARVTGDDEESTAGRREILVGLPRTSALVAAQKKKKTDKKKERHSDDCGPQPDSERQF